MAATFKWLSQPAAMTPLQVDYSWRRLGERDPGEDDL